MLMRRLALYALTLVGLLVQASATAQVQLRAGAGYVWDFANTHSVGGNEEATTRYGHGQGVQVMLAPGGQITDFWAVEIGLTYASAQDRQLTITPGATMGYYHEAAHLTTQQFLITPSTLLGALDKPVAPYARMGILLGRAQHELQQTLVLEPAQPGQNPESVRSVMTSEGGWVYGFSTGMGLQYNASYRWGFFVEVVGQFAAYYPNHRSTTGALTLQSGHELTLDNPPSVQTLHAVGFHIGVSYSLPGGHR